MAIHAEIGVGIGYIYRTTAEMRTLVASIFALLRLSAGAADAAIVGVHVRGIGVGVHGHHYQLPFAATADLEAELS